MSEEKTGSPPIDTVRGRGGVSVSVFENEIKKNDGSGTFKKLSFTPQKRFTKDDGKTWNTSKSYTLNEAVSLRECLDVIIKKQLINDGVKSE